jgi:hypothetical protein
MVRGFTDNHAATVSQMRNSLRLNNPERFSQGKDAAEKTQCEQDRPHRVNS